MLSKGNIIEKILIRLGNTRSYNDDMSREYQVCSNLYEQVIKDMMINNRLLFNAVTVPLNYADRTRNKDGEYKYNLPLGFLNLISISGVGRIEGYFIFSPEENLEMTYCKDVPNNTIPDYMEEYITGLVGVEMCLAYAQYQPKIGIFQAMVQEEEIALNRVEINTSRNWVSEVRKHRLGSQRRRY